MIPSNLEKRRGRIPAVTFPIERVEVIGGQDFLRRLEQDWIVSCYFCNHPIRLTRNTVHLSAYVVDDMQYVTCPLCMRTASVMQYFDRVTWPQRPRPKRYRRPEDLAGSVQIITPEG